MDSQSIGAWSFSGYSSLGRAGGKPQSHHDETPETFLSLFSVHGNAVIIDEPVPRELVSKYIELGIPEKADAFIGAFVDWLQIPYLISANRHFFRNLQIEAFRVLNASEFQANLREDMP